MESRERIIHKAQELFHKFGIKSVTMDDIAKALGMSKKTLYQYFRDKDELVLVKTMFDLENRERDINNLHTSSENAVHGLIQSMKYTSEMFQEMNPTMFYDMQKFHPKAWQRFREFKEDNVIKLIERNLTRGISEGYYRPDIDIRVLSRLRAEELEMAMRAFPAPAFNIIDVNFKLLEHFLYGITTLKGHRLINKYKQLQEEE